MASRFSSIFRKLKVSSKLIQSDYIHGSSGILRNLGTQKNPVENFGKVVELSLEEAIGAPQKPNISSNLNVEQNKVKLNYVSLKKDSKILSGYIVDVKSRRRREKSGLILLEGKRLIQDATAAGHQPVAVFFSRVSDVVNLNLSPSVKLYHALYKDLQLWSDVTTTQGVIGIFSTPDTTTYESSSKLPLTIVCDSVRDPGNLGSILRTAAAVGCKHLILSKGCVDLWEPKVLRSAAGAHFRLRIHHYQPWGDIENLLPRDSSVYLADSNVVPQEPDEEPLEVYELDPLGQKVPVSSEPVKRITAFQKRKTNEELLPLQPYTDVDFSSPSSLVLVLGGETEGLSTEAYYLAKQYGGERIFVPLENEVESLNSGTALGVLAYEIRRQRFNVVRSDV